MSEEEYVYKISFPVRDGFKYTGIAEETSPGSLDIDTKYWETVVEGIQNDPGEWAAFKSKYSIPEAQDGKKYVLHAWIPLDVEQPTSTAELYNITIQMV